MTFLEDEVRWFESTTKVLPQFAHLFFHTCSFVSAVLRKWVKRAYKVCTPGRNSSKSLGIELGRMVAWSLHDNRVIYFCGKFRAKNSVLFKNRLPFKVWRGILPYCPFSNFPGNISNFLLNEWDKLLVCTSAWVQWATRQTPWEWGKVQCSFLGGFPEMNRHIGNYRFWMVK